MTKDELFALVPAVYRVRDAEPGQGGFLEALIGVVAEQADVIADDLAGLYDNWFIETCDPWVVPAIGDLIAVRRLHAVGPVTAVPRAYVANTLGYRRRKGTPAMLEQLSRDVAGWPARIQEGLGLLATTQNLNHRRATIRTATLRDTSALERLETAFDTTAHGAEVRPPPAGRFAIADVNLHVWRLEPFHLGRVTARPVSDPPDGRYRFDPLGTDAPLFNEPLPEETITSLARERHVPGPLPRRPLYDELEARRAGVDVGALGFFGTPTVSPVFEVFADLGLGLGPVAAADLTVADLSDPPPAVTTGWRRPPGPLVAAVDPVLGRLAFRSGLLPSRVEVTYTYAFGGRVGAGPYDRAVEAVADALPEATFVRAVGAELPAQPGLVESSLVDAVAAWTAQPAGAIGVIAVLDSRTYTGDLAVTVPAGSTLVITTGAWPAVEDPDPAAPAPTVTDLQLDEQRPHVLGSIVVTGGPGADADTARGDLVLDGLAIEGSVTVASGDLGRLTISYSTVVPGVGAVAVTDTNLDLVVTIDHSIISSVEVPDEGPVINVDTTIVDGAVTAPHADATLDAVAVVGDVTCRALEASDCIFAGDLSVERTQQGCVRFSYVTTAARTPRRFRCQPDLVLQSQPPPAHPLDEAVRVTPQFTSTRFGDPAYGMLDDRAAPELLTGSSTQTDMGAFGFLNRALRDANIDTALREYLPFGLQAGIRHVT